MLDFPASPSVGQKYPASPLAGIPTYTWDGEKWTTQGGSIVSASPGTLLPLMDAKPALVGVSTNFSREDHVHPVDTSRAPFDAMAYSGLQINGAMEVSQEFGASGVTVPNGTAKYVIDGWVVGSSGVQSTTGITGALTPPSYTKSLQVAVPTANASPAAGDFCYVGQLIEGYRVAKLNWGTANAQPITLAFWVFASRTGLYGGAISNGAGNRSYPFTFTVNAISTWEYKTIIIPGDTTGTWTKDNTSGMAVRFSLMAGSSFSGAAGVWAGSLYFSATGCINGIAANTDTLLVTGVIVLPGNEAPSAARSPFVMRPYDQELAVCRRYYRRIGGQAVADVRIGGYATTSAGIAFSFPLEPVMRAAPTATTFGTFTNTNNAGSSLLPSASAFSWQITAIATGMLESYGNLGGFSLDARL